MFDDFQAQRFRFIRKLNPEATKIATKALLDTVALFAKARGIHRRRIMGKRSSNELDKLEVALETMTHRAEVAERNAMLLRERWNAIEPAKRPDYTPEQRFRILDLRRLAGWNRSTTAERLGVCISTISAWEAKLAENPDAETIGCTAKPNPPINRVADVARSLAQTMCAVGFTSPSPSRTPLLAPAGPSPNPPFVVFVPRPLYDRCKSCLTISTKRRSLIQ